LILQGITLVASFAELVASAFSSGPRGARFLLDEPRASGARRPHASDETSCEAEVFCQRWLVTPQGTVGELAIEDELQTL
jgi:hypothetical protein